MTLTVQCGSCNGRGCEHCQDTGSVQVYECEICRDLSDSFRCPRCAAPAANPDRLTDITPHCTIPGVVPGSGAGTAGRAAEPGPSTTFGDAPW